MTTEGAAWLLIPSLTVTVTELRPALRAWRLWRVTERRGRRPKSRDGHVSCNRFTTVKP
jgi:hypothetical protein